MSITTATPPTMPVTAAYASFGARFVALIIDYIIIGVLQAVIITPILAVLGLGIASQAGDVNNMDEAQVIGLVGSIIAAVGSTIIISYAVSILYFAFLESSKSQGSVGKMALGIKVTDLNGERITFGKALLRSFGKIVSSMIMCIGYLMAAFTEKKQGLHDMIASTLVVKK